MIRIVDGIIKSLESISRYLKYNNMTAYRYSDNYIGMVETERKERAENNRPAIISEDTRARPDDDVDPAYSGSKGEDFYRGSI